MNPQKGHRSDEAAGDKQNWSFVECESICVWLSTTEMINRILISSYSRVDRSTRTRSWTEPDSNKVSVVLETDPVADRNWDLLENTFLRRCTHYDNCVSRPEFPNRRNISFTIHFAKWKL